MQAELVTLIGPLFCKNLILFVLFCQERNNQDDNKVKGRMSYGLLARIVQFL